VLDGDTGIRLMDSQAAGGLDGLIGRSWRSVLAETVLEGD
jgi:hypothetical protein